MTRKTRLQVQDKDILMLEDRERELISPILMKGGKISGTELKRIYLEKYTYWEMNIAEKRLLREGLLLKKSLKENGGGLRYEVPGELIKVLSNSFLSKALHPSKEKLPDSVPAACCKEFSILWYLWRVDTVFNLNLLRPKSKKRSLRASEKKVAESLGIERESARFLILLLRGFSASKFLTENALKKWSDTLIFPHRVVKEVYKIAYYTLREGGELGSGEVGKDNIEFLLEELAALRIGRWYDLEDFVMNPKKKGKKWQEFIVYFTIIHSEVNKDILASIRRTIT